MPDANSAKTISIYDLEFKVPQPYAEGHVLTAIEAKQLNQVFAENIANNQRAAIKKAIAEVNDEENPKPDALNDAIAAFNEYASKYQFTEASAGGASTLTPLEREALKIAKQIVAAHLAKKGKKVKDIDKDKLESEYARVAQDDKVLKLAKKALKDREDLGKSLDGLLGGEEEASEQQAAV